MSRTPIMVNRLPRTRKPSIPSSPEISNAMRELARRIRAREQAHKTYTAASDSETEQAELLQKLIEESK